jgi:tetrahydromethanopterin S-methyltransferase subunit G
MTDTPETKIAVLEERMTNFQKAMDAHHAITNDKLDKLLSGLSTVSNAAQKANERVDDIEPKVEHHEAIVNKGLGIAAFVGIVFGALGSGIFKVLGFLGQ